MPNFTVAAIPPGMTFPIVDDVPVWLAIFPSTAATEQEAVEAARVALGSLLTVEPGMMLLPVPVGPQPSAYVLQRSDTMVQVSG